MKAIVAALVLTGVILTTDNASAREPGWSPVIVATGSYRDQIKSMPIEQRPYRPLHFYGNTIRRMHYRGTPLPAPRDVVGPVISAETGSPRR